MRKTHLAGSALLVTGALAAASAHAQNPAEVLELPQVEVVGTTPLPGSGVPLRKLPANAQVYTSRDLRRQHSNDLSEFLDRNASGLTVNAAQGNPYQPDVNVRGFSASPLLGTPQGVSVFFDGVRINEPFGDAVNWDLIPTEAISSIQLIPGSNPAFGLNTLGGAIAVYSKSGASAYPDRPGGSMTVSGGSFGRRTLGFQAGGTRGEWDAFVAGHAARDRGWAAHNPSRIRQLFAKVGWQNNESDLDLTLSGADNRLEGTQTLPLSFGDDIRQAYTYPDRNTNRLGFATLKGSHAVADDLLLSGQVYVRRFLNRNLSSNVNDDFEAGDEAQAINDAASIDETGKGLGLQLTHTGTIAGRRNQIAVGASIDHGSARFVRTSQDATFTPDRGTVALNGFEPDTDSDSTTRYLGLFVSDSLDLDPQWTLTLAGRFNRADVRIADRSGTAPELNGSHRFTRFNPAVGLNYNPTRELTAYASYNEGMRAPTAIELTCADPEAPCRLPNSFLSDPPLNKVVSRTVEVGARGKFDGESNWGVALFRTDLNDDIQFISSNGLALNAGYFRNVGTTRRQGLEFSGGTRIGAVRLDARYSYLDATFRSGFVANSPSNSSADANGAIVVKRGDRIPSLPRHALKLRAEWDATSKWSLAAVAQIASSVYARGDENNLDENGRVPGYAVFNLDTRYQIDRRWQLFARIDNLFDRRYANFATLGRNVFTGPQQGFDPANARDEPFRGYGVPRGAWVGVQVAFD